MDFCQKCGKPIGADDKFCQSCGAQIPEKTHKKTWLKYSLVLVVAMGVLIIAGIFVWWRWHSTESGETIPSTAKISGVVVTPKGLAPENFEIIGLGQVGKLDKKGSFTTESYENGVSTVFAMQKGKEFGLIKILVASSTIPKENNIIIDSQSTAVALVFTSPFLITDDPLKAKEILSVIEQDEKVKAFAKVIEDVAGENDPLSDSKYADAFQKALESVINTLNR